MSGELRVSRFQANALSWIEKLQKWLPAGFRSWFYSPIPRAKRQESLFERWKSASFDIGWPSTYSLDPRLEKDLSGIAMFDSAPEGLESPLTLSHVTVLPEGVILKGTRIHSWSSLYSRLTPEALMKASRSYFFGPERNVLQRAVMVPRQLVDRGTYGDYVIEFLLPLTRARAQIRHPLILDTSYIERYAGKDLVDLGICETFSLSSGGIEVESLTIIPPCQRFDNFRRENIDSLVAAFPVGKTVPVQAPEKVYLSRLGFCNADSIKQKRCIKNENDIELFLAAKNFLILRPDGTNNSLVRESLANAKIVVFSHGSAAFQWLWGKPDTVIELASEKWWNPAFIRLGRGFGVRKYHVISTVEDEISLQELEAVIDGTP